MSSISYPSRTMNIIDIPEARQWAAEFSYNFFESDEKTNDEGVKSGGVTESSLVSLSGRIPRFVKMTWSPCVVEDSSSTTSRRSPSSRYPLGSPESLMTAQNLARMQSEESFSNFDYASIAFQDSGLDGKLFQLVSGSLEMRSAFIGSLLQSARTLNDLTSDRVDGNFLIDAINSLSSCGIEFSNQDQTTTAVRSTYKQLRELILNSQVSNKVIGTLVTSIATDKFNLFADEMTALRKDANSLQNAARAGLDSTSISSMEYDTGFVPIKVEPVDEMSYGYETRAISVIGYILEKSERIAGTWVDHEPIIVTGATTSVAIDSAVKYDGVYAYSIRTVAAVRLPMITTDGDSVLATGLISSKSSSRITVQCTENSPPPSVADFLPDWDYANNQLRLIWSFPVNPQRDIKRFQIFRRDSTDSAFELLREYDFDDSEVKSLRAEKIPKRLITKMIDEPSTVYVDEDFDKDSTYIYTLCCVDAHGFSSNYAAQYAVSFDRFKNKIEFDLISRAGAPKAFPNLYLKENVFVDTMKTSGFNRATVYFDPEYLKVTGDSGEDLSLLPLSDPRDVFKLQIINTDLQRSQALEISLNDLR